MTKPRKKRQPYRYALGETIITSWRKIYAVDGVLCHKRGEFYEPVSPGLMLEIEMAKLEELTKGNQND